MKLMHNKGWLILILMGVGLVGCSGTRSFTTAARPGETVVLAVGWQKTLTRQNMTVTITPAGGGAVTYAPGDSRVRGVVNLYPDPVSGAAVGTRTQQNFNGNEWGIGLLIEDFVTGNGDINIHDSDWWQTTVVMDLPVPLSPGMATVQISNSTGPVFLPVTVEILPGTSASNLFNIYGPNGDGTFGPDSFDFLSMLNGIQAMERAANSTVTFSGSTIPHSMQMTFAHTPGVGKTWVVNPRGDIKNVAWSDDGANITVMLTPAQGITLSQWLDLKFYVAGGISGLTLTDLKAYDISGNLITGVNPAIQ